MKPSAFSIHLTKNRTVCGVLIWTVSYTRLEWFWSRLTVKAFEIWCPVSACAFGNEFVASLLFLVGKFQLRKAITISILSGKHNDWFGLKHELLSFPGADPPGQFEVRLFPFSLFDLTEVCRKHRESGHSLPVPKQSEEIPILSFTLGKQIHFLWEFIKAVYYLSFLCLLMCGIFFVSSLTLVWAVLLNLQWVVWVIGKDTQRCLQFQSFILRVF